MSIEQKIKQNINLAPFTTFKIGGPAKFFIEVNLKEELAEVYEWAKENKQEIFILGGGSNILINNKGVDGLVVKIDNNDIAVHGERLDCGAGASLTRTVSLAASSNLSGLEWAAGIPGATIGGAVAGNAGAFGSSISGIIETVAVFNIKKKRLETFSNKDCRFNYRESIFKNNFIYLIWQVVLKMRPGEEGEIEKLMAKYLEFRDNRQPKLPSAGSVFKNLAVADLRKDNANLADLANNEGKIKNGMVGAAWLIEMAGLKGKTIGGAKVSLEHANFIINTGRATSTDVAMLISYIKQQIRNRFKVQLREEVRYLGF